MTTASGLMHATLLHGCIAGPEHTSFFTRYGYLFPWLNIAVCLYAVMLCAGNDGRRARAAYQRPTLTAVTAALALVTTVALLACTLNAWMTGLEAKPGISLPEIARTLQPTPVLGPPARPMPSSRELWGADALCQLFNFYGLQIGVEEILESYGLNRAPMKLPDLQDEARRYGFHTELARPPIAHIDKETLPVLVGMQDDRYAMLIRLDDELATVYEHHFGYGYLRREEFATHWDGQVLRIRPPPINSLHSPQE
jgi:hypothetical protein